MKDPFFWMQLAASSTELLGDSADKPLRGLWIDDFLPERITDTRHGVEVGGIAWVGRGPREMHPFRFVVSVLQKMLMRRRERFSIERFDIDAEQHTLQLEVAHFHGF